LNKTGVHVQETFQSRSLHKSTLFVLLCRKIAYHGVPGEVYGGCRILGWMGEERMLRKDVRVQDHRFSEVRRAFKLLKGRRTKRGEEVHTCERLNMRSDITIRSKAFLAIP
jgi:hypothetical protein